MTRHLCISVAFLDSAFHGKGDEDPEWPPSPMRLFQALVAGSRAGRHNIEWTTANADAFRWLEQRQLPIILSPCVRLAPAHTLYVPNNDGDKVFDRQARLTSKVVQPHRLLGGDTLFYIWSIDETEWASARSHVDLLCKEARHLLALGWGIDQVVGDGRVLSSNEIAALPGQHWQAWDSPIPGRQAYRVPTAGSLQDLEQVYHSFSDRLKGRQYSPPLKLRTFQTVTYIPRTALPPRYYAVFELPEGVVFRQVDAGRVGAMLRSLTCNAAKNDTHRFPGGSESYVAGHINAEEQGQGRFSYLPVPTIGHPYADGMIRRLMIAEPYGGDGSHASWAQNRLRNTELIDHDGNMRGMLLNVWRPESKAMIRRYVQESRTWQSVTPVILPGHDDFNKIAQQDRNQPTKAERLLFKCLVQAGIPLDAVESATLRRAPFWPGSQHPRLYQRPDYLADHKSRPGWHVLLVFREPFGGPLAIGAGRHCGLGLFASASD